MLDDLKQLAPRFQQWYNQERLHSSLGYQVPWQQLITEAAAPSSSSFYSLLPGQYLPKIRYGLLKSGSERHPWLPA